MAEANWKEINFYDELEEGQTIKAVTTYADGTEHTVTGVAARYDGFGFGGWVSKDNILLVKKHLPFEANRKIFVKEKTQEEKDAEFVFPKLVGAIISVEPKPFKDGTAKGFVFNGSEWRAVNVPCARARDERSIRDIYQNFSVVSEGVNV